MPQASGRKIQHSRERKTVSAIIKRVIEYLEPFPVLETVLALGLLVTIIYLHWRF